MSLEKRVNFSQKTREKVRMQQNNCCAYCGSDGCLEIHHIVPEIQADSLGWSRAQIRSRNNAVGLCAGEGNCHETFDALALGFNLYFDDIMEEQGRIYPGAKVPEGLPLPSIRPLIPREPARFYDAADDK